MFDIREDDLSGEPTRRLVALHMSGMQENTPPEHVFALNLSGLKAPEVTLWSAWDADVIVGIGALKALDGAAGEVKSMRTHPQQLRKGVAAALLAHIIAEARRRNYRRLSLETGRGEAFEPALALYRRTGFVDGGAFGDYQASDFNQSLHLDL